MDYQTVDLAHNERKIYNFIYKIDTLFSTLVNNMTLQTFLR